MRNKGFTLVEILVTVAIIGVIVSGVAVYNHVSETTLTACAADLRAHAQIVYQAEESGPVLERDLVYQIAGSRWKPHYHYVPNNSDANKGHGNDLDLCDEENPGKSTENRDCLDIRWIIVCDHNHNEMAKYNFVDDDLNVYVVGGDQDEFARDLIHWGGKDPNLQKWINR